jgi:hypothetical protein
MHFARTVDRSAAMIAADRRAAGLWLRPTFRLEGGRLVHEPPADTEAFVKLQDDEIRTTMGGSRVRRLPRRWFVGSMIGDVCKRLRQFQRRGTDESTVLDTRTIDVNLAILRELADETRSAGATLALVDASLYLNPTSSLPATLERFCRENAIRYVDLSADLRAAAEAGTPTRWPHDAHFNEAGNAIFAAAMHRALAKS